MTLHETAVVAGVSEACKYNCHNECPGCGCDCHRPKPAAQEPAQQIADQAQLTYCHNCQLKRPLAERFCRKCGERLGSLKCPGCAATCEPSDAYCYMCGFPMSKEIRDRLAAEGKGAEPKELPPKAEELKYVMQPSVTHFPIELAEQAEQELLRGIQSTQPPPEAASQPTELTFRLPQGTFKLTSKGPTAGKVRGT